MKTPKIPVAEVIRVSTKQQAHEDRASIPAQKAICKRIVAQHDLTVVKTLQIEDVSGANVMTNPKMHELLQLITSGQIKGIVTREWSRILRPENPSDFVLIELLRDNGVKVYLPDNVADLSTSSGMFMAQIQLAVAANDRRTFLERSLSAKEQLRREGRPASAPQTYPFGVTYNKQSKRWEYVPGDSDKVRLAYELFTSGTTSWKDLSKATGIRYHNLPIILRNPIYIGCRVYDQKRDRSMNGRVLDEGRIRYQRKMPRVDEEVIRVKVIEQGLVPDSMWFRAQELMKLKKEMRQRRHKGEQLDRFLYRGFLICSICGEVVYCIPKKYKNKVRDYYICRCRRGYGAYYDPDSGMQYQVRPGTCKAKQLSRERLEPILDSVLCRRLADPEYLDNLITAHQEASQQEDVSERIGQVQKQIRGLASKKERLKDLYIEGELNKAEYNRRLSNLREEERVANAKHAELAAKAIPGEVTSEELARLLSPLLEWDLLTAAQKRTLLSTIVPKISVADYEVHGVWLRMAGESGQLPPGGGHPRPVFSSQDAEDAGLRSMANKLSRPTWVHIASPHREGSRRRIWLPWGDRVDEGAGQISGSCRRGIRREWRLGLRDFLSGQHLLSVCVTVAWRPCWVRC